MDRLFSDNLKVVLLGATTLIGATFLLSWLTETTAPEPSAPVAVKKAVVPEKKVIAPEKKVAVNPVVNPAKPQETKPPIKPTEQREATKPTIKQALEPIKAPTPALALAPTPAGAPSAKPSDKSPDLAALPKPPIHNTTWVFEAGRAKRVYIGACFACHDTSASGVPQRGDVSAWAPRLAKGMTVLVDHTRNGFKAMPARGGNPKLSDEDLALALPYLLGSK